MTATATLSQLTGTYERKVARTGTVTHVHTVRDAAGEVIDTRKSKTRVYTHAVAIQHPADDPDGREKRWPSVVSYSGSAAGATKEADAWRRHSPTVPVVVITLEEV